MIRLELHLDGLQYEGYGDTPTGALQELRADLEEGLHHAPRGSKVADAIADVDATLYARREVEYTHLGQGEPTEQGEAARLVRLAHRRNQ